MPRLARVIPDTGYLHIMCRGNNRQDVFHSDDDCLYYKELLLRYKEDACIDISHYCLMTNHIHLLVCLNSASQLSKFMKQLNLSYFRYYKSQYGYTGHFWQDRYKSIIVQDDIYLIQVGKYIELNPVKAGMVEAAKSYPYSSYNYYAHGKHDKLITDDVYYPGLGKTKVERQARYRKAVIGEQIENSLERGRYLGDIDFILKMEKQYKIPNQRLKTGRPRKEETK